MQDLRARLAEAEEMARTAERQKNQLQRLLQEFRRHLTTLQLDTQRMLEKVSLLESRPLCGEVGQHSRPSFTGICLHLLVSYGIHQSAACDRGASQEEVVSSSRMGSRISALPPPSPDSHVCFKQADSWVEKEEPAPSN